jgi:hypothetical protein
VVSHIFAGDCSRSAFIVAPKFVFDFDARKYAWQEQLVCQSAHSDFAPNLALRGEMVAADVQAFCLRCTVLHNENAPIPCA